MSELFRDTVAGFFIRTVTANKFLRYPEEIPGFQVPVSVVKDVSYDGAEKRVDGTADVGQEPGRPSDNEEEDVERGHALQPTVSHAFHPVVTKDGVILVDWYSENDSANPKNWSSLKKTMVGGTICALTFTVYFGSSCFSPSIPGVVEHFGTSEVIASCGLALYVMAYGLGALVWSPLSEIPALGRNGLYIGTFFIFTVLMIPTAMTDSLPGLMVLRFITGWFGAPCLSTGPGSFADMLSYDKMPYILAIWAASATLAPAVGPLTVAYATEAKDWQWSMWELLWLSSFTFTLLFFVLPETSADNILLRRAARLRAVTGNQNYKSQSEIKQEEMSPREIVFDALVKPWEMNILDPAILFSTIYVALCYAVFYSFFEAFPQVFPIMYGFDAPQTGLTFISIVIGVLLAISVQLLHFYFVVAPSFIKNGPPAPEFWLKPSLVVTALIPIGLFIFAWTSSPDIYWLVPLIGVVLNQAGSYQVMNSQFSYIANIYPMYAASLFAANAAARSCLAGGAILFSRPLFISLGVNGGVSLLAGVMCVCSVLLFGLYRYGPALRAKSRFVVV